MSFEKAIAWVPVLAVGVLLIFLLAMRGVAQHRQACEWITDEECRPIGAPRWGSAGEACDSRSRRRVLLPAPRRAQQDRDWQPAPDRTPAPPAAGRIALHAMLCGVSRGQWAATVEQASRLVVASGGQPFVVGQTVEGCPRSFDELRRQRGRLPASGFYFSVWSQGRAVAEICGGAAVGCAELGGAHGFMHLAGAWWDPLTAAHEVGHLLGLNHSSNPNDLMYPSAASHNVFASGAYVRAQSRWNGLQGAYQGPPRIVRRKKR